MIQTNLIKDCDFCIRERSSTLVELGLLNSLYSCSFTNFENNHQYENASFFQKKYMLILEENEVNKLYYILNNILKKKKIITKKIFLKP